MSTADTVETETTSTTPVWRTPLFILGIACLIALVSFGIRSSFGLFLEPMTTDRGWDREVFALAMAIQNLLWGLGVPFAGALQDRFGPIWVIAAGGLIYAGGILGMAHVEGAFGLYLFCGIVTGTGVAFTNFSLALAAIAKVVGPERRSLALGLGASAGSMGQVVFSPLSQAGITSFGWNGTMIGLAGVALCLIPLAFLLPKDSAPVGADALVPEQSLTEALREAATHPGYALLTFGFFVCGFHVAFISVHLPAYIRDIGLAPQVGAYAMAIVGLFNILGAFIAGWFGQRYSKKSTLSCLYLGRAIVITIFVLTPPSIVSVYTFAAVMGLFWLSTVPLTTGIVAQVFGVRYMSTLFGLVFLGHQLGSFLGVWLGGYIYDLTGSYDFMWWAGVAFGLWAAIIHLPIDESPVPRLRPSTA